MDWSKEFNRVTIPYADCYVYENQTKKRLESVNEKFNKYYVECVRQTKIKLTFAEEVKVIYIEQPEY